jgi:SWI/SNF-related matrix-associated actin-dependent regulator 1 of chromatin subfamily A
MSDGVGITLTKASKVLFCELPWTPSQLEQAEDRIHRIGQAAASIECYYMIGKRTIDEHIWDLLVEKQRVIGQVVEGGDYLSSSSSRSIADIVRSLRNE